jgi:NADH-quinone oxidoreductase subunit C
MDFSSTSDIAAFITKKFGDTAVLSIGEKEIQPFIEIDPKHLLNICRLLYTSSDHYFDFLNCISAIDNGPEEGTIDLIYHLSSIPFEKTVVLKLVIPRLAEDGSLPDVASVSSVWKTADWHEREAFDLVGINFQNHPDLRRILLPADWQGHPLRKDYVEQEKYHGIKVKY